MLVTTHHLEEAEQCDRVLVMADGRVVADGPIARIVGDRRTVRVRTPAWQAAFDALDGAGLPTALVGRTIRVSAADPGRVRTLLADEGVEAAVDEVEATFEETFVALTR